MIDGAVDALLAAQSEAGCWSDFTLAPGAGQDWVTGYVGSALASSSRVEASTAARAGWEWLRTRQRGGGWGFNGVAPTDADSTSAVLSLATALGENRSLPAVAADLFLARHHRPDGGLSTYADVSALRSFTGRPAASFDGWLSSHVCVTAAAAQLPGWQVLQPYLLSRQHRDGEWRSYWWHEHAYATAMAVAALRAGEALHRTPLRSAESWANRETQQRLSGSHPPSTFGLALLMMVTSGAPDDTITDLVRAELARRQRSDGSWVGDAELRVPAPTSAAPSSADAWVEGGHIEMAVVTDQAGLFTTATVLRALTSAAGPALLAVDDRGGRQAGRR